VQATLVNVGGEYVIEMHGTSSTAVGHITTLPVPCAEGQTTTTIGGPGTLTFETLV
jgi:hypothetical protein